MAFTFNWAGTNIPTITVKDTSAQNEKNAELLGKFAAGYERKKADEEYANMLTDRDNAMNKMASIKQQIAQLQQRNAVIRQQLSAMQGTAVTPNTVPDPEPIGGTGWAMNASKAIDY